MSGRIIEDFQLRQKTFVFDDRYHASELLAERLRDYERRDAYVLAIPAGGVPVGVILSRRLNLPLDVLIVRKIHIPWNMEAGFGAMSWDGATFLNQSLVEHLGLNKEDVSRCIAEEKEEINKRLRLFRVNKPFPDIGGKTAIIVDDGIASGFTMLAAISSVKNREPKEILVAVPTASNDAVNRLKKHVDKIVCLNIRGGMVFAVADAYRSWYNLENEDVVKILKDAGYYDG